MIPLIYDDYNYVHIVSSFSYIYPIALQQVGWGMGVRKKGKRGHLPPALAGYIVCFSTFLKENSMFLGIFRQIVYFCPPPWKILPSPGKKVCGRPCVEGTYF